MMSDLDLSVPGTYQLSKCCKRLNWLKNGRIDGEYKERRDGEVGQEGNSEPKLIQTAVSFSLKGYTVFSCLFVFSFH